MSDSNNVTILFVDDEESILEIAEEFFTQKGYNVITADNGLQAVSILEKRSVDCCFTDINMPEMDGLELAEYIRTFDNTIPVIVMTGYPSLDNTIRTLKNGVVDFLIKPVNLEQMEFCVRRVLRERRLFVDNLLLAKELEGKERIEKLNVELLGKVEELNKLNRIMSDFTQISTSSELFKSVVETCLDITEADESRFYVINEGAFRPFQVVGSSRKDGSNGPETVWSADSNIESVIQGEAAQASLGGIEKIIMETVSDEIPLLLAENTAGNRMPDDVGSFMAVPLKIREKVFGILTAQIRKDTNHFTERDLYYLSFMTQKAAYAIENLALYENIYDNLFATLSAFVTAVEVRDAYTNLHSTRVAEISMEIGKSMGCTKEELDILNFAGRLHDIGKIGIRDDILLKPGPLDGEEFEKIKEHPVIGGNIVGQLGLWDREQEIIRHHHERYDGSGYPDGLSGKDIPFLARILSVADAYDAMASDRAYRKKMPYEKVLGIIESGAGKQFDPEVVSVFMELTINGRITHS